ncbi:MAG: hypothetical protein H7Z42_00780, partial [Roseiflexaceae bacterium]|nr:hypothetical protein [Roseiflexaceae bacterium]
MSHTPTPAARRMLLALLVGALIVWALALWSLLNTVGSVPGQPEIGFFEALQENLTGGLGPSQLIPALLMLGIVVAAPLVIWGILEEYGVAFTTSAEGLHIQSYGLALIVPWESVVALEQRENQGEAE